MGEQYFAKRPASRQRPAEIHTIIRGHTFTFRTDAGVFSRGELDRGTQLLIDALDIGACETILDLGCGYGAIGIVAASLSEGGRAFLTDVNERAVSLTRKNIAANGVANAEVRVGPTYEPVSGMLFDKIVCNPPIRAGRTVVDEIITGAPGHLLGQGSLWLVARTRQGADSIRSRMSAAFGNAEIVKRGSGFKVIRSTKGGA